MPLCEPNVLCICIGTKDKVCRQYKIFKLPVVYATDRSKAVVPVLFLFCVALWFILRGASCLVALLFVLVFLQSF